GSERVLVGAVLAHVPRAAWIALEDDVRRPWPPWPRLLRVATPAEAAYWRARHGWACVTAVRLQATILRRGDRRVYGAGAVLD
ncbi:hypothetical protein, partial [Escherichia coli]|uniref:hypothetical protein n=1 Tax=Escherichia coli TaxID=562 RepID=UPI001BC8ABBA